MSLSLLLFTSIVITRKMQIETIIENFSYPIISKIKGKSDRTQLEKLQKKIHENAAAIETTQGGGEYGYLGLAISDADYNTLTGYYFICLGNMGLIPTIPVGATQHAILAVKHNHAELLKE